MSHFAARWAARLAAARDRQDGQGLAEYALMLGLIAVVAIAAMTFLGSAIDGTLAFDWTTIRDSRP